ncbi:MULTISPECIES: hypothetical protein [unclassified Salinibacterium]|uniref:hypothetical protein n=1 Tax=unclassified Salinibacterium TaxID=2632331 RepID=UPI0018CD1DCE|nr:MULTISPECIES: hypothetical protein [unclassified Salinibacterium]MBH0008878.1 hypothetical protein [Salinibacterium sp. SWN1162]MBH0082970.1 hypothetical protein [Salinibacterium sp. SWN167]
MEASPQGREITTLDGDAGAIVSRAKDITTLGGQMISSAAILKDIADGAAGQQGLAFDKLQEVVGDCYEELKLAGERYRPTGWVLKDYGTVVAEVQPLIKRAVENCETEWAAYRSRSNELGLAQMPVDTPTVFVLPGEASPDTEQARQEGIDTARSLANSAYDEWASEAQAFDAYYETWETAFNQAAELIGDATEGGIQDSNWDDLDGAVAGALEVLKWVGIALAVLGVIVGGPFIAALAAIVAIATLLLTIYAFSRGNASVLDLVLAGVSVVPFGSLGKLFGGNKLGFVDDMAGGLLTSGGRANIVGDFRAINSGFNAGFGFAQGGVAKQVFGGLRGSFANWATHNGSGLGNVMSRFMAGISSDALENPNFIGSAVDGMDGLSLFSGAFVTHLSRADQILGLSPRIESPSLAEPLWGTPTR